MSSEKKFMPEAMKITREDNKNSKEMKDIITVKTIKHIRMYLEILNVPTAIVPIFLNFLYTNYTFFRIEVACIHSLS